MYKYPFAVIFVWLVAASCGSKHNAAYIKDEDFKEFSRLYSPNRNKILLYYASHKGPFGYHIRGTAVINVKDTAGNLLPYTLPKTLTDVKWVNDSHATAQFNIMPSVRRGNTVNFNDTTINGVQIKVTLNDFIELNDCMNVLYRETSPDRKHQLVVYRYGNDIKRSFIHLSVIPVNGNLPKYGNYFIANLQSDYIYYARWSRKNELMFFSDDVGKDLVFYGLVKTRPNIGYQIVSDDDRYKGKVRWVGR